MLKKFIDYFSLTKGDKEFISFSEDRLTLSEEPSRRSNRKILIDCSHVLYPKWQIKNVLIAATKLNDAEIHALYPSKLLVWSSPRVWFLGLSKLLYNKDILLMRSMGAKKIVAVSAADFAFWAECLARAKKVAGELRSKQDVLDLQIDGISVGDLVYDSYLKRYRVPTVDVSDRRLVRIIALAYYCHRKVDQLFARQNYEEIYLTHAVYVFFGLVARVGLKYNARVFVVQNNRGLFVQRLTASHPLQTPRFSAYRDSLKELPSQELDQKRADARARLEDRLAGKIDSSISYMRKSAYEQANGVDRFEDAFPGRPRVLVLLHCFFDSPHIYKWMLYEDFYEWIVDTLRFLEENKVNAIVKEHPNGMEGNDRIVAELKALFGNARFVSKHTNTKEIIAQKQPLFALTVYGTVTHELAYLGLPVINAGDNPHSLFSFSKTPSSKLEYKEIMSQLLAGTLFEIDRNEIEEFYYAHYLAPKPGFSPSFDQLIEKDFNLNSGYHDMLPKLAGATFDVLKSEAESAIKETDKYQSVV